MRHNKFRITFVLLLAIVGLAFVMYGNAATSTTDIEAESGTGRGVTVVDDSSGQASGNKYVRFGPDPTLEPISTPTKLQAFVGGNSIALTWRPVGYNGDWHTTYNVYRDGQKIATTKADPLNAGLQVGTQYVDSNVSAGKTYSYAVASVTDDGRESDRTAAVSATQPANGPPAPTVIIDASAKQYMPDLAKIGWFEQYAAQLVKTWYPKIAYRYAWPDYSPPSTITIKSTSQADYDRKYPPSSGVTIGNTFYLNPGYQKPETRTFLSLVVVHEAVHVMEYYQNGNFNGATPRWFVEGLAQYAVYEVFNSYPWGDGLDANMRDDSYFIVDEYEPAANFLRWIETKYNPNYLRQANVASYKNRFDTFDAPFVQFSDGRNIDQAWGLYRNQPTRTGTFRSQQATSKCLDVRDVKTTPGSRLQLWPCNTHPAQKITLYKKRGSSNYLLTVLGHCLAAGTAIRTQVAVTYCDPGSPYQEWVKRSDGTLFSVGSGYCLEIDAGGSSTPDGAYISTWSCNGGRWQKWTTP